MNETITHIVMQRYAQILANRARLFNTVENLQAELTVAIAELKGVDNVLGAVYKEMMPPIPHPGTMTPGWDK